MLHIAREPELLAPLAPFDAYRDDVARLADRAPIGPADDAWLVAAHTLARAATLGVADRPALLAAGGDAVLAAAEAARAHATTHDAGTAQTLATAAAAGDALHALGRLLAGGVDVDRNGALGAMQALAADEERGGAFQLAFTTLRLLRAALAPALDPRQEGMLLAQQGRAARQLGALDVARELYDEAVRSARRAQAPDVSARALLGAGTLAAMRGNYPEARAAYRAALKTAERAENAEFVRAAHHGLLVAALAADDADTALVHGWAAFERTPDDAPDVRAEMLVNLGDVVRHAGEMRAALGACLRAIELSTQPRVLLPALATAAVSAGALGERRLVAHLAREVECVTGRSGQPYENARALVAVAEAMLAIEDPAAAQRYAERADRLAQAASFHEVAAVAQQLRERARKATTRVSAPAPYGAAMAAGTRGRTSRVRTRRAHAVVLLMETMSYSSPSWTEGPC